MCDCNSYDLGQCPCAKNVGSELREDAQGYDLIVELVQLARAGLPYRDTLKALKRHAQTNRETRVLAARLAKNLSSVQK